MRALAPTAPESASFGTPASSSASSAACNYRRLPRALNADHVAAFADYMSRERGLAQSTIRNRCWWLSSSSNDSPCRATACSRFTPHRLDLALLERVSERPVTAAARPDTRRHFALPSSAMPQARGWCPGNLAATIKAPRVFPLETLPAGPSWAEVQQLLAMTATARQRTSGTGPS